MKKEVTHKNNSIYLGIFTIILFCLSVHLNVINSPKNEIFEKTVSEHCVTNPIFEIKDNKKIVDKEALNRYVKCLSDVAELTLVH